jgi:hypothetical protein
MAKDEARRFADQIDGLDALPEDPRTTLNREKLERWQAFAMAPWSRPANLAEAVTQAEAKRVLWLIDAIDMMAFGPDAPPEDALEAGARRLQACRALCRAAAEQSFPLFGMLGETADRLETIPGAYLTVDYRLGSGHNVLERDGSSVPESDDAQFDRLHKAKWFEVQIGDKRQFLNWLLASCAAPVSDTADASARDGRLYGATDAPLLDEMERLLVSLEVASVTQAAMRVVDRAKGGGTPESRARRLQRAYDKSDRVGSKKQS